MIFKSQRIGKDGETFVLYKFRTMVLDAPVVSTDNLVDPARFLLPFGSLLRRYSVDELPQFWNVLKGDLGIVGPRPSLPTEHGLISARRKYGVDRLTPGITGYAQVNGRDAISMDQKVAFDLFFLNNRSIFLYLTILAKTLVVVLSAKNVVH